MRISGYKKVLIVLGIMIALVPALGFPASWENTFLIIAGLLIILIVIFEWQMRDVAKRGETVMDDFITPHASQEAEADTHDEDVIVHEEDEEEQHTKDDKPHKEEKVWKWSGDEKDSTLTSDE